MSFIDIITEITGSLGRFDFIPIIFACGLALVCFDCIIGFILGSISSLFKR